MPVAINLNYYFRLGFLYILAIADKDLIYIIFNILNLIDFLALPEVSILSIIIGSKIWSKVKPFINKKKEDFKFGYKKE